MGFAFAPGIYEALLSAEIADVLQQHPEPRSVFGKVDPEEEPGRYAAFLAGYHLTDTVSSCDLESPSNCLHLSGSGGTGKLRGEEADQDDMAPPLCDAGGNV